jgi:hypothetical protein
MILLIVLLLNHCNASELSIGYFKGHHYLTDLEFNNEHPYIEYVTHNISIIEFKNSFGENSTALSYVWNRPIGKFAITSHLGFTTGYRQYRIYNGKEFHMWGLFITNNIMLFGITGINYYVTQHIAVGVNIMGNSVNLGTFYTF